MIFYLHYILLTSGLSSTSVLLGVFIKTYSDASQGEIGFLIMSIPFAELAAKPLFCAIADRRLAHRSFLVGSLIFMLISFSPLLIIPFFPEFYQVHPRLSYLVIVIASLLGNGGLAVAWSLGESLAINMSQKTKTPYSRMRLMGSLSWGFYGYIIGQINEVPYLPKYVPALIILNLNLLVEVILILLWKKEDFIMFDGSSKLAKQMNSRPLEQPAIQKYPTDKGEDKLDETTNLTQTFQNQIESVKNSNLEKGEDITSKLSLYTKENTIQPVTSTKIHLKKKNPQLKIFKMILRDDGRVIKYFLLFTIYGIVISPTNFVFLSYEDVCKNKNCNFSNLAGSVLLTQAAAETVFFFILPWILKRISKSSFISIGLLIVAIRYYIYATFFYSDNFSPYWALAIECGYAIGYCIATSIIADVALATANLSRLFIPELRKLGYLTNTKGISREQIEAEENSIKMTLRATMQALNSGSFEGLGFGLGNLISGVVVELYSFTKLYELLACMAVISLVAHQALEVTRSRWSDTYQPEEGTKAYEIMNLQRLNTKPKLKQLDLES